MSIIQEIAQGNYIKTPDKTQRDMINIVNKYFASDMKEIENSKEGIILDVQQRLKPMITNLVRAITIQEGDSIIKPLIKDIIEDEMKNAIKDIESAVEEIKKGAYSNWQLDYIAKEDAQNVQFDTGSVKFKATGTIILSWVNGVAQTENVDFIRISNTNGDIAGIRFIAPFVKDDRIKILCLGSAQGGV